MARKTLRVRFLRGKAYEGKDYLPRQEADVEESWARRFIQSGAAVLVEGEKLDPTPTLTGKASALSKSRDPQPTSRDPAPGEGDDRARLAAFLDRKADEVITSLAAPATFAEPFLKALYDAEESGKGRVTVLEAIAEAAGRLEGER